MGVDQGPSLIGLPIEIDGPIGSEGPSTRGPKGPGTGPVQACSDPPGTPQIRCKNGPNFVPHPNSKLAPINPS